MSSKKKGRDTLSDNFFTVGNPSVRASWAFVPLMSVFKARENAELKIANFH